MYKNITDMFTSVSKALRDHGKETEECLVFA